MKSSRSRTRRAIGLVAGLLLLALLGAAPWDGATRPHLDASISLSPGSGPPGTTVAVTGSGFPSQSTGVITWGSQSGSVIGNFAANPNGAFSTSIKVPANASGGVKVWACTRPRLLIAGPVCASRSFKVTTPAEEPEPTPAPVPTRLPTPVRTDCDVRNVVGEGVIDFERFAEGENLRGVTLPEGVRFVGDIDLRAFSPAVATHSGSKALRTDYAGEFGSGGAMMRLSFVHVQDFVGMYVGLNERIWATSPITAVLTAYSLDASGNSLAVGTDSVSFGPAPTPIRECLSVSAPGIYEVTLTYGGAGEPEVIDDLVFRGPATPVPQPEDNQPPRVTILQPEEGVMRTELSLPLQGEVREDRELGQLQYRVNAQELRDLVFTPAGMTAEGDHLYLFAIDPMPDDDLRTCGDNLIEVVARDTAGNVGMDLTAFPMYIGDLEIEMAEPVQVVYGADLVRDKGTAFRVRVASTFECAVRTYFHLGLPEDQWSTAPVVSGGDHIGLPPGWEYPDTWGLVTLPARARHFSVMLPYVPPGQEENGFGAVTPAGLVSNVDGINPDVRVLPRPIADVVRYAVEIDPANSWPEQDEDNNRFESAPFRPVTTRPYRFIAYPVREENGSWSCTPTMAQVEGALKRSLEYVLGTFPIADQKISGVIGEFEQTWDLAAEPREVFLFRIAQMAKEDGDFGIAMTCAGGGASGGSIDAVFVGARETRIEILAHEFTHVVVPMDDVYSKDCYCQWGERYCELPGGDKFYCCYDWSAAGDDYNAFRVEEEAHGVDPHQGCTIDCGLTEGDSCDDANGVDRCASACAEAGGTLRGCPDRLPTEERTMVASDGFWANRWRPEEGKLYFMDGPSGDNWIIRESMRALGQPTCWNAAGVDRNGYVDLLQSDRFHFDRDPVVLLVSGSVSRDGEATFAPFLVLPDGFVDVPPGSTGSYRLVLKDGQGAELSESGFDLSFWQTDPDPGMLDEAYFVLRLEWLEDTQTIELRDATGRVLAARSVSTSSPVVEIVEPAGGIVTAPSSVAVRWRATDPDGDALSYSLAVSEDAGATWQTVATRLQGTVYHLPVSSFHAGTDYLVRVRVTDGVNTAKDVTDASFQVMRGIPRTMLAGALAGFVVLGVVGIALLSLGVWRLGQIRRRRKVS